MTSLSEVFCSFQGEGPFAGEPTLFVRTAGCPIRCHYCDTTYSYVAPKSVELRDLSDAVFASIDNPVSVQALVELLSSARLSGMRWVSLTGGEPLLYPEFGAELFSALRGKGLQTHLETAALNATALAQLLPHLDHLSMDWKLPSTLADACDHAEQHEACLELALAKGVQTTVKIVMTAGSSTAEWNACVDRLAKYRSRCLLLLQPVSPAHDETRSIPKKQLLDRARDVMSRGHQIRVMPQLHKEIGLR